MEGSRGPDDPFGHDIIFIEDNEKEYPRIDFIIAKYKWELEGTQGAVLLGDMPVPVLPKPYLIAMKLKAGSLKDDYDVSELYRLLTEEEKKKTQELAKQLHREKKLARILNPVREEESEEPDQLL